MLDKRSVDFFLHFFRGYPRSSALMVGLLILGGLAEGVGVVTLVPLLEFAQGGGQPTSTIGRAITSALEGVGLEPSVPTLLALIVVTMTVKAGLLWLAMTQVGYTVAGVTRDLRLRLMRALFEARWRYFGSQSPGSFANTISGEALRSAWAYRESCSLVAAVFQVLMYLVISALISWRITLFALVSGGLLVLALNGFVRISRDAGRDQTRLTRSLTGRLVDVLQGIKAIKAMAREHLVLPLLEHENEGLNHAQRRQVAAAEGRKLVQEPVLTLLLATALFVLLELGDQPLSAVLVLAFVFYRLLQQINGLQTKYQALVVGESAFWSLRGQIDEAEAQREESRGDEVPERLSTALKFDCVSFAYEPEKPILTDLTLEVPAGSFVAIGGESGSGKTTLADLALGLHVPDSGAVLVDGRPLTGLSLRDWRSQIGYVPQELLLFNDTIARNVTLGDDAIPREDVERALRLAGAWEFVSQRPEGMDAEVGDKGGMFSGGQRQRIAIARGLVHRPSLLVLDEVTTALDAETERAICETLRELAGEVTILSISHQPALRRAADIAYLMREGRLIRLTEQARAG